MTDKAREEMSALMDGEASELELHRVLKCSETDEELRSSWRRYHLTRSVIRGEARDKGLLMHSSLDITAAVSQAIADEPAYAEESSENGKRGVWFDRVLRPLGSVAVAASVSAMVIFGWQTAGGFDTPQSLTPSVASATSTNTRVLPAYAASTFVSSRIPAFNGPSNGYILADDSGRQITRPGMLTSGDVIRLRAPRNDQFNRYILSHSGNAAFNTLSGVIPYARVVTLKPGSPAVR
ncbi:MAG: hypothetical protein COA99_07140 [Moraxellaceae bacterium]|nr:MAG: hypothetical protein COA99_07140 [Moraxellaceae bacterium]